MLSSDDTACIAFDFDQDSQFGFCTCGHSDDEHESGLGGCRSCVYVESNARLIADLAARAGEAKGTLAGALAALCPGGKEHGFRAYADHFLPWCLHCRYTEWGVKVGGDPGAGEGRG